MTEPVRIPHADNPTEVRQAFQQLKRKSKNIDISDDTNLAVTAPIILTGDTLSFDINSLATTTKIDPGDFIPHWDITATATNKKITFANFESYLSHDNLVDFVANEHIDWTNASSALLTSSSGRFATFGIGIAPTGNPLSVYGAPVSPALGSANAITVIFEPSVVDDVNVSNIAMSFGVIPDVTVGKANLGKCVAVLGQIIGDAGLAGYLKRMIGLQVQYGIAATGTGTVDLQFGLYLQAYHAGGTINNAYDLLIGAPVTGGTVTNSWSIYGASPEDSYLAGPLGLGVDTPDARLEIETGAAEGKQAVTIDQNDDDQAFIDFQGASAASAANNISTWTAGNSIEGFIWVEINGTKKRVAFYGEPTS